MPKEPKQLRFVDISFDPATNVMNRQERGRRKKFRRSIAVDGATVDSQMWHFVPPGSESAQSAPSSFRPFVPPAPPTPSPPLPPLPPPNQPSPQPSAPSFEQPNAPSFRELSPPSFQPMSPLPSPPPSPLPSPQLQPASETPHQPPTVESPPDSLSSIVARLEDLQWDLMHPEMWSDCIVFSEVDEK
ncbi:hypothetical protein EDD22DRAFT_954762 [Suillus occidentalis]|nr:hypothetical protein EDD22DRAFT_954762 [Suillus occidentalis]